MHEEILKPQFEYELVHLLRWYVQIEKVLLLEYQRMGLIDHETVACGAACLGEINAERITANPEANMSDIAFAIERYVEEHWPGRPVTWHVDRSRNDYQSSAQLMAGRHQLLAVAADLLGLGEIALERAAETTAMPMPGYTHYQAAQVISPGFYLSAMAEQVLQTGRWLGDIYDRINCCPLGAGAMAGQELAWDRERMARLLGFAAPQRHALTAVASREWTLRIAGELSMLAVALSRFATDFMLWGSSEYGFIDLPDELAGISSAMPQKKNFPVLERIRGKTAHMAAFNVDFLMGQRSNPYTNLVEVSKEAGAHLTTLFATTRTALQLFTTVIEHVQFREDRMRAACGREYLGGFALANMLTLGAGMPWRKAQVVAGSVIVEAMQRHLSPGGIDSALVSDVARSHGYAVNLSRDRVRDAFSPEGNLGGKRSDGSTAPEFVETLLQTQRRELYQLQLLWGERRTVLAEADTQIERLTCRNGEEL
ncbi:MAG TPA: lyase family protein [Symbiobacteriaceae bacterium]|jgi:argininosuccinate lyase